MSIKRNEYKNMLYTFFSARKNYPIQKNYNEQKKTGKVHCPPIHILIFFIQTNAIVCIFLFPHTLNLEFISFFVVFMSDFDFKKLYIISSCVYVSSFISHFPWTSMSLVSFKRKSIFRWDEFWLKRQRSGKMFWSFDGAFQINRLWTQWEYSSTLPMRQRIDTSNQ